MDHRRIARYFFLFVVLPIVLGLVVIQIAQFLGFERTGAIGLGITAMLGGFGVTQAYTAWEERERKKESEPDMPARLCDYVKGLATECNKVKPDHDIDLAPGSASLEDLFVTPRLEQLPESSGDPHKLKVGLLSTNPTRFISEHSSPLRILVVGEPGVGKTTNVRKWCLSLIQGFQAEEVVNSRKLRTRALGRWSKRTLRIIPLFARLSLYTEHPTSDNPTALGSLPTLFKNNEGGASDDLIRWIFEKERAVAFLDGVDEIHPHHLKSFVDSLILFLEKYKNASVIVTSRAYPRDHVGLRALPGFATVQLQEFSETNLEEFVTRWFKAYERAGGKTFTTGQAGAIAKFLNQARRNLTLVSNPLMLGIACKVFCNHQAGNYSLPMNKAELLDAYMKDLLETSEVDRSMRTGDKERAHELAELTVGVFARVASTYLVTEGGSQASRSRLLEIAECHLDEKGKNHPRNLARDIVNLCIDRARILTEIPGTGMFKFRNSEFLHYFAALGMEDMRKSMDRDSYTNRVLEMVRTVRPGDEISLMALQLAPPEERAPCLKLLAERMDCYGNQLRPDDWAIMPFIVRCAVQVALDDGLKRLLTRTFLSHLLGAAKSYDPEGSDQRPLGDLAQAASILFDSSYGQDSGTSASETGKVAGNNCLESILIRELSAQIRVGDHEDAYAALEVACSIYFFFFAWKGWLPLPRGVLDSASRLAHEVLKDIAKDRLLDLSSASTGAAYDILTSLGPEQTPIGAIVAQHQVEFVFQRRKPSYKLARQARIPTIAQWLMTQALRPNPHSQTSPRWLSSVDLAIAFSQLGKAFRDLKPPWNIKEKTAFETPWKVAPGSGRVDHSEWDADAFFGFSVLAAVLSANDKYRGNLVEALKCSDWATAAVVAEAIQFRYSQDHKPENFLESKEFHEFVRPVFSAEQKDLLVSWLIGEADFIRR